MTVDLTALENTAAIQILVFLHKKKGWLINYSNIRKNVKASPPTIYRTLSYLSKANLVKEELQRTFPFKRIIKLTPLGEKVAEKLYEIERLSL